ncbi:MAG: hypothetical protein R3D57_05910 [Hyphomicrobiaceae bacterium]
MAKTKQCSAVEAKPPDADATDDRAINWAAVKRRYQNDRRMTYPKIAMHYGLAPETLRDLARSMGWRRPGSRRKEQLRPKPPATLTERIIVLIDGRLTQMEIELQKDHLPPAAEFNRQSNELTRLIRGLGQVKVPAAGGAADPAGGADDDQDRWRRELVERIRALKDRLKA